jgi:capsular exopolysaccharide synthesis family protein
MSKIERALRKAEEEKRKRPAAEAGTISTSLQERSPVEVPRSRQRHEDAQCHSEHFRKIAARLKTCCEQAGVSDVLFTSAVSGEGKTTTAINCALSLCKDFNQSVCLMDCDLRNPSISGRFSLNGNEGIVELLKGAADTESMITPTSTRGLSIIASRRAGISSLPLLNSDRLERLIRDLKARFDFVLVDSPPILPVADAVVLSKHISALVLVIESGKTRKKHIEQVFEQIERDKFIGFVMNYKHLRMPETYNYSKYYNYGGNGTD